MEERYVSEVAEAVENQAPKESSHKEGGFTTTHKQDGGREQEAVVITEPSEGYSPEILAKDVKEIVEEADRKQDEHLLDNYYNKGEVDSKLALKADKSTTYTKTETNALLDTKQDTLDEESVGSGSVAEMLGFDSEGKVVKGTVPSGSVVDSELDIDSVNPVENKAIAQAFDDLETGVRVVAKSQVAEGLSTNVGTLDKTPFAYMTSGGQTDVETGYQRNLKLVGSTIVKNQWAKELTSDDWTTYGGSTTYSDGVATFTASSQGGTLQSNNLSGLNHICLIMFQIKLTTATDSVYARLTGNEGGNIAISSSTNWQTIFAIRTPTGATRRLEIIDNRASGWDAIQVKEVRFIDLTQMFGSNDVVNAIIGNDTSKQVANLMLFLGGWLPTTYDTGTLIPSKSAYLKSVEYNQWDEEWELGQLSWSAGANSPSNNHIRSKNYIRVVPNAVYYFKKPSDTSCDIHFYDINKNHIEALYFSTTDTTFTTPSNCAYIRFMMQTNYGTTYNHDICIFIYWDGSKITYEPYEQKIEPLPNIEINGILKVDGSGNVYADGDELYPDGTGKRRYGVVDLGTLSWSYTAETFVGDFTGLNVLARTRNAICSKYEENDYGHLSDKQFGITPWVSQGIFIKDSSYTDATTFKSAMSGVYLVYELATETDITSTSFNENIFADDFGTLQFLDENNAEIVGLQGCEIFYKANVSGFAESLYVRTNGEPSDVVVQSELTAEETARTSQDTILLNAIGGTLRQCLCVKETLDFEDTDFVDLGTLNWVYSPSDNAFYSYYSLQKSQGKSLCTVYVSGNWSSILSGNKIVYLGGDSIWVKDTAYTDATTFKNAMKGVLLAYEKASE